MAHETSSQEMTGRLLNWEMDRLANEIFESVKGEKREKVNRKILKIIVRRSRLDRSHQA
jgi:hypothetical protein